MSLDGARPTVKRNDLQERSAILSDSSAVVEHSRSISDVRANDQGTLAEVQVRDLSKSLADLKLKKDDAVDRGFLRYGKCSLL